ASPAGPSAEATHATAAVATATASSTTASHAAIQGGDVDATARSQSIARQQRACRRPANIIGGDVTRIGSARRHDIVLCHACELILECQDAGTSHLLLRIYRSAHVWTWWEFRFAGPVWTCWGVRFRFQRGCRRPPSGSCLTRL